MTSLSMTQEQGKETERILVLAARAGDANAFALLVEKHRDLAFAYAYATLRNKEEAEDATQEAFIRALQSLPQFRSDAQWGTWLMRILRNHCIDLIRKRKRQGTTELTETFRDPLPSPEFQAYNSLQQRELQRAIAALPDKFRVPLTLHYTAGRTYKEIAHALEIPETTVTGRIARALHLLRRKMPKE